MTSTITILCPEGIVMAADSRITQRSPDGSVKYEDSVPKIYPINEQIGLSFWGFFSPKGKRITEHISELNKQFMQSDDVNIISRKICDYLKSIKPEINQAMGIHIAGFVKRGSELIPQLRHVFNNGTPINPAWSAGCFINENSNIEQHNDQGIKSYLLGYGEYIPYRMLFNGENSIANTFVNVIPSIYTDRRLNIQYMNLREAIDFAKFVIETGAKLLTFYKINKGEGNQNVNPIIGGKIYVAKITKENGFEWVEN